MTGRDIRGDQILLFGLLPLLGGTTDYRVAAIIGGSSMVIALLIRCIYLLLNKYLLEKASLWLALFTIGLSLSYGLYLIAPFSISQELRLYFILIGVTPLVYIGCLKDMSWATFIKSLLSFIWMMFGISLFREFLGAGNLFGRAIFETGFPPLAIMAGSAGAFIILGLYGVVYRRITRTT